MTVQNEPIVNLPFLYVNGFVTSNDATTPNTILDVSAGQCRDSSNVYDITLSTAVKLNTAGVGLNGIDTGVLQASKVYAIYAIADGSGFHPTGVTLSLSTTQPALPFGYGIYRLIGWWITNSSVQFVAGYTAGTGSVKSFYYDAITATAITAGAATSYASGGVSLAAFAPAVNNLQVGFHILFDPNAAGDTIKMQPGNGVGDAAILTGVSTTVQDTQFTILSQLVTGVPTVNYKVSTGSAAVAISVTGFTYTL